MTATGTERRVCELIAARQQAGIAKYGTTVAGNPLALRQWLQHALEEALDLAIYLKRSLEEMDAKAAPVAQSDDECTRFADHRAEWLRYMDKGPHSSTKSAAAMASFCRAGYDDSDMRVGGTD